MLLQAWRVGWGLPLMFVVERGTRTFHLDSQMFNSLYCTAPPPPAHTHTPITCSKTLKLINMALIPFLLSAILKKGKGITKYLSASCIQESQGSETRPGGSRFKTMLAAEGGGQDIPSSPPPPPPPPPTSAGLEAEGTFFRTAPLCPAQVASVTWAYPSLPQPLLL